MFEIYREGGYNRRYRVVYFTELDEHSKDAEINRALGGEDFFAGFLKESELGEAKLIILGVLARLNDGEPVQPETLETLLADHLV